MSTIQYHQTAGRRRANRLYWLLDLFTIILVLAFCGLCGPELVKLLEDV